MKLHTTEYIEPKSQARRILWFSNQKDALREHRDLEKEGIDARGVFTREVPTNKKDLLEWLNRHVSSEVA